MARQIFIGIVTEGTTDIRFLKSIVERTFTQVALDSCRGDIEIYVEELKGVDKGNSFAELMVNASKAAIDQMGAMTVVIHTDSDVDTYEERYQHKFIPALEKITRLQDDNHYCKQITPLITVRMVEAWMLADKELLKSEINTRMSDAQLGISRMPEKIADPKGVIEEAIRIATEHLPRKRYRISIADLYGSIGASISLESLSRLDSYMRFRNSVYETYQSLGYV